MIRRHSYRLRLDHFLLIMSSLLLLAGITLGWRQHLSKQYADTAARHAVTLANQGKPSAAPATTKPSSQAVDNYTVAADFPRYLIIPKIQVKARIYTVGVTGSNAIGTPRNVYDTAWYSGSSLPGKSGVSLIDGHVSSWKTRGVFYDLKSLGAGDHIQVQRGDNSVLDYTVVKQAVYETGALSLSQLLSTPDNAQSGLNLITCTGDVLPGTNEFNKRIVVYTKLN